MPTTAAAALIVVLAVLPGLLGEKVFNVLVGSDWRQKEWRSVLRLIGFSAAGATVYAVAATAFSWPSLIHLVPKTYDDIQSGTVEINSIFLPYAGHVAGGLVAGLAAASGVLLLGKVSPRSPFPSAWDDFVRTYSAERWVIVGLKNGDVYAGRIANADMSAPANERDLVLAEPCLFNLKTGHYVALNYQYMFIAAESLYSIAGIYDQTKDSRLVRVGDSLFEEVSTDGTQAAVAAAETT